MEYLTKADLEATVLETDIDTITDADDSKLDHPVAMALATIKSKLGARYDLTKEFKKSGTARNDMLVKIACDVAIMFLYKQTPFRTNLDDVVYWFDLANKELGELNKGVAVLDLPLKQDMTGKTTGERIKSGGATKLNREY